MDPLGKRLQDSSALHFLIDACKGRIVDTSADWFYKLFVNRSTYNSPQTISQVRQLLRQAWWVEEEDLRQTLVMLILKHNIRLEGDRWVVNALAKAIRYHLIFREKVFARQGQWKAHITQTGMEQGVQIFKELLSVLPLSWFQCYIIYLTYILELQEEEMCDILLVGPREIYRYRSEIRTKLEEYYDRSKNNG
jgi:hypothetical protein